MILGIIAMLSFTRLAPGAGYADHVLPGLIIIGFGMGAIFAPAFGTATLGVDRTEAGIASAMVNTSQQVGGSVGTALLSTLFASAAANYVSSHPHTAAAASAGLVHGYDTGFWWAAALYTVGLLIGLFVLPRGIHMPTQASEPALAAYQARCEARPAFGRASFSQT